MNRIEKYERIYLGENIEMPKAVSRIDKMWEAVLNGDATVPFNPVTRIEEYMAYMIDNSVELRKPVTRLEKIMYAICKGEKADAATKAAFNDIYLKYIYELKSGENMFFPNRAAAKAGVCYSGRTVTLDGEVSTSWRAQIYTAPPVAEGEVVTIRYKYISGELTSHEGDYALALGAYGESTWASDKVVTVSGRDYATEKAVVASIITPPSSFNVYVGADASAVFDNLKFEIAFEKGDTTK